jgi:hypothetical protein
MGILGNSEFLARKGAIIDYIIDNMIDCNMQATKAR